MADSAVVGDPVKVGDGLNSYHTYLITCRFNNGTISSVNRRFSDFDWLRNQLQKATPGCIVPPLPEKVVSALQDEDFLSRRKKCLQLFLNRTLSHPLLCDSTVLHHFLADDLVSFHNTRESLREQESRKKPNASWWGKTMQKMQENSAVKAVAAKAGKEFNREKTPADLEFEVAVEYINKLLAQVKAVEGRAANLHKQAASMKIAWNELSASIGWLQQLESSQEEMKGINLAAVIPALDARARASDVQVTEFAHQMADFVRLVVAVKETLNIREDYRISYQAALAQVEKWQGSYRGRELSMAEDQADLAKQEFDQVHQRVMMEYRRFRVEKSEEISLIFNEFSNSLLTTQRHVMAVAQSVEDVRGSTRSRESDGNHKSTAGFDADEGGDATPLATEISPDSEASHTTPVASNVVVLDPSAYPSRGSSGKPVSSHQQSSASVRDSPSSTGADGASVGVNRQERRQQNSHSSRPGGGDGHESGRDATANNEGGDENYSEVAL